MRYFGGLHKKNENVIAKEKCHSSRFRRKLRQWIKRITWGIVRKAKRGKSGLEKWCSLDCGVSHLRDHSAHLTKNKIEGKGLTNHIVQFYSMKPKELQFSLTEMRAGSLGGAATCPRTPCLVSESFLKLFLVALFNSKCIMILKQSRRNP